jgi:uncharacterized protein
MAVAVHHRPELQRFEATLSQGQTSKDDAGLALCAYRQHGQVLVLHHTEVPRALEGQGIAAALVQTALAWARSQGLQVRPTCSYVAAYMRRHPETHDLLEATNPP